MDDKTIFQNPNLGTPQPPQSGEPLQSSSPPPQPAGQSPFGYQPDRPLDQAYVPSPPAPPPVSVTPRENPFAPPPAGQSPVNGASLSPQTPSVAATEPPPPPPRSSFLSLGKFIKILVGIVALSLVLFLVFKVIPGFFNKDSGKVTLTYWGLWEDAPTIQAAISDFERANPNIKIDYSKQDVKQYREKLSTRIQNGTGPDIFKFHNTWIPMFRNDLLPISSDAVTKEEFSKNFYPIIQKDLTANGAIYGIPLGFDTLSLYVNADLLQAGGIAVPTNWQDFITAARQLTVKDESGRILTAGAALGTYDNITHAPDIISLLLVQNGAKLEDLNATLKETSDALTFYSSFAKGNGNVWDVTLDPSIISFANGSLGMFFGYSWDYFIIKAANPNLNFFIAPVPHLPGQEQTIASYWVEGISSKSKHQEEALLFMKYLTQKETAQKLYTEQSRTRFFGEPYARVDLGESLKDNPVIFPFVSQGKDAVSSFFASDTYDNALNSQMNTYLGNAVRSILNDTSPQSAAETLVQGVSQVLTQYGQ